MLDMRTIVFSNVITDIVCLVVIVLLWQQTRRRFAGAGFFVFDFALQTAALLLIILRGQVPAWISFVFANTMVMAGALLGYMGLTRFVEKKSSQIHNYILLIAFAFVHAYFTFVQPNQAARNLNVSVGLLIICFQCAWLLLRRVEPGMRPLTRGVGIVFAAYCVISVIRIVEFFTGAHLKSDYLQSGIFEQLVLISNQMLFILLTFSLALMFNKRLLVYIKAGEEKFSKAFHSSPYAITITRISDGQIIEVNDCFLNITGYEGEDIRGKTTPALHLWDRGEDRALVVSELASKGKVQEREFQFRKKSGERITGLFSAEIITVNNEKCVLSSIDDITERKQAEEALRESEDKYKSLIDNFQDIIFTIDLEGKITFASQNTMEKFGYESAETINMNILNFIQEEDRQRAMESLQKGMNGEKIKRFQIQVITKSGGRLFFECSFSRVYKDRAVVGAQAIARDITERKQAEEEILRLNAELELKVEKRTNELHKSQVALLNMVDDLNISAKQINFANKSLEATNKELESFSYSVSHDLRAPLRSIDGLSNALLEDYHKKLDAKGKNYLKRVRQATQQMGILIDDILKLSRLTRAEFNLESVDLSKMFREIIKQSQKNDLARIVDVVVQKGIVIEGDPKLMRIVLVNLIENAWKFTGRKERAKIEFGMIDQAGEKVIFIRDNGVGFDMTYVGKLFGTFQRLHTVDEFEGTGIGLATVQRVINRHGGKIWAEGEVGKGATFYFTLPE